MWTAHTEGTPNSPEESPGILANSLAYMSHIFKYLYFPLKKKSSGDNTEPGPRSHACSPAGWSPRSTKMRPHCTPSAGKGCGKQGPWVSTAGGMRARPSPSSVQQDSLDRVDLAAHCANGPGPRSPQQPAPRERCGLGS